MADSLNVNREAGELSRCPRCGAEFTCNPGADCWCAALPPLPMPDAVERCLCPPCLKAEIERRSAERLA